MLVFGDNVFGKVSRLPDCGADDRFTSDGLFQSMPVQWGFAKHRSECPERHRKLPQKVCLLVIIDPTSQIGRNKRGTNPAADPLHLYASYPQARPLGPIKILYAVTVLDLFRKQFSGAVDIVLQVFPG